MKKGGTKRAVISPPGVGAHDVVDQYPLKRWHLITHANATALLHVGNAY